MTPIAFEYERRDGMAVRVRFERATLGLGSRQSDEASSEFSDLTLRLICRTVTRRPAYWNLEDIRCRHKRGTEKCQVQQPTIGIVKVLIWFEPLMRGHVHLQRASPPSWRNAKGRAAALS